MAQMPTSAMGPKREEVAISPPVSLSVRSRRRPRRCAGPRRVPSARRLQQSAKSAASVEADAPRQLPILELPARRSSISHAPPPPLPYLLALNIHESQVAKFG